MVCCVSPLASSPGSLVGNLLPRVMLHERGVPVSSANFAKTESNKPYICTVRHPFFFLSIQGAASVSTDVFLPEPGYSESYFLFIFSKRTMRTPHACRFLSPDIPLSNCPILDTPTIWRKMEINRSRWATGATADHGCA